MNAREMFKIGDRVKLTRNGFLLLSANHGKRNDNTRHADKYKPGAKGTVVGFSVQPNKIRIRVDGYLKLGVYEVGHWEKI